MSDAAITTIVTGAVTITGMIVGFLTLLVKLKHASAKAEEAATRAGIVESKLDDNTRTTESVNIKTDNIYRQTDGVLSQMYTLIQNITERVSKLENYNHETAHRTLDALNTLNLKLERILTVQGMRVIQETGDGGQSRSDA